MTQTEEQNVPALRFPEFRGEWEGKKLGELGFFKNGINKDKTDFGFGVPFVNLMDVFGKKSISSGLKLGKVNASVKEVQNYSLQKGDVIFIRSSVKPSGVGETIVVTEDMSETVYSGFLIRFREKEGLLDSDFMKNCFWYLGFRKRLLSLSTTSANTNINQESLNKLLLRFPSLPEQQKIASFLSSVDRRIAQLGQKKTLLQRYKKGMMQKLFSQELRFKDAQGDDFPDWEEKRAGEVFHTHTNKNHNSDLPILAATQDRGVIPRNETGLDIKSSDRSIASYKIIEPGDFVISLRSFQGGIEYSEYLGISSPAYIVLKPTIEIEDGFFKFLFKKEDFISRLNNTVIGIRDGKQIPFSAFAALKLSIPSIPEQQKIADFLSSIDRKIDLVSTELDHAKAFKKGLLQQMFI